MLFVQIYGSHDQTLRPQLRQSIVLSCCNCRPWCLLIEFLSAVMSQHVCLSVVVKCHQTVLKLKLKIQSTFSKHELPGTEAQTWCRWTPDLLVSLDSLLSHSSLAGLQ